MMHDLVFCRLSIQTQLPSSSFIAANASVGKPFTFICLILKSSSLTISMFPGEFCSGAVRENPAEAIANLQAAVRYLASLENVDESQISSLGWCFGGQQSLQLALNTEPDYSLASTVIYYGRLVTDPEALSKIEWPILGIFGDRDNSIPVEDVRNFESALNSIGIPNEIRLYEGVGHAFANPSRDSYAPEQTSDAWQKTLAFLENSTRG